MKLLRVGSAGKEKPVILDKEENYRDLSNQIANDFNVKHESPQILVIKDGECHTHLSHTSIYQFKLFELI